MTAYVHNLVVDKGEKESKRRRAVTGKRCWVTQVTMNDRLQYRLLDLVSPLVIGATETGGGSRRETYNDMPLSWGRGKRLTVPFP